MPTDPPADRAPAKAKPSAVRRLLMVLVATGASLLLLELGLRMIWTPWSVASTPLFEPCEEYGWLPRPGIQGVHATPEYRHVATNSVQGLRGSTIYGAEKAAGHRARVLFLGDSFTYGLGSADDETFVAKFGQRNPDLEAVNAGANGYSTRECVAVLDHLGEALRPDLTVYCFFWNDLDDNLQRTAPDFDVDESGKLQRLDRPRPTIDPLRPRTIQPAATGDTRASYLAELLGQGIKGLSYRLFGLKKRAVHTPELREEALRKTERLLTAMKARASELGTPLVLACIPDQSQVDPDLAIVGITPLNYELQADLLAICNRLAIPMVDLLPGLQAAQQTTDTPLYYFADRHLTPAGNRAVAELLDIELAKYLPPK